MSKIYMLQLNSHNGSSAFLHFWKIEKSGIKSIKIATFYHTEFHLLLNPLRDFYT